MYLKLSFLLVCIVAAFGCASRHKSSDNQSTVENSNSEQNKPSTADSISNHSSNNVNVTGANKYFKLLSAVAEPWVAGVRGGGSGTEYYFNMVITTDQNLKFGKVWIADKSFDSFLYKEQKEITGAPITFLKGDSIAVRVSDLQNMKPGTLAPPQNYNGEALIEYILNGKSNYFTVKEIKKLPTLYKP